MAKYPAAAYQNVLVAIGLTAHGADQFLRVRLLSQQRSSTIKIQQRDDALRHPEWKAGSTQEVGRTMRQRACLHPKNFGNFNQ
jgi:hypothetical protein